MIFKLAQYQHDKSGEPHKKPLTSVAQVSGLIRYLRNPQHDNHIGVRLTPLHFENCTNELGFGATVGERAEAYRVAPKSRGRPWGGEVAEHVIYAPPPGVNLTVAEREFIGSSASRNLFPSVPSVWTWHLGDNGRDELHIVGGNFIGGHPPVLRITELRNRHSTGYLMVCRHLGEQLIEVINQRRGKNRIPTLTEIRQKRRKELGHQSLAEILAEGAPKNRDDIVAILETKGWKVRPTKKALSVTPPEKTKAYRIPWETLHDQIDEALQKKGPKPTKAPEIDPQRGGDPD